MSFPCTKCGQCCLNISKVMELTSFHNGDGICKYYVPDTGCTIYLNRPMVCRIDEGYKEVFSTVVSKQIYYQQNAEICNELQRKNGLSEQYRVEISYEK